jgi:hypothetical protein
VVWEQVVKLPGVARRQLTFFVLPKKVSKERRAHYSGLRLPAFAFDLAAGKKTRCAQTVFARNPAKSNAKAAL